MYEIINETKVCIEKSACRLFKEVENEINNYHECVDKETSIGVIPDSTKCGNNSWKVYKPSATD